MAAAEAVGRACLRGPGPGGRGSEVTSGGEGAIVRLMPPLPAIQPSRVTVMIKPVGALCNLDCTYCYYLPTKAIYDGRQHRMTLRTLEDVFAGLLPKFDQEVTVAWQGGEPMLAGLEFFERAIAFQEKYRRPNQRVNHALQTNGTLLDEDWCRFFKEHAFLIGLSLDGPARFHDHYRVTNSRKPSADQVLRGMKLMQSFGVQYNILCVLNDYNVRHPDEIMGYLVNLGSHWLQFIPAIEWEPDPDRPGQNKLAPYSPDPKAYGQFLCRVFDRWFERYRDRISVRIFDAVLNRLVLGQTPLCILDGSCHTQLTIEHDGAVFGCDHFVERRWQFAKIGEPAWQNPIALDGARDLAMTVHGRGFEKLDSHDGRSIETADDLPVPAEDLTEADFDWFERVAAERLGRFAVRKQTLPDKCKSCPWKPFCYGGCPKHRSQGGDVPEASILCESYIAFYEHAMDRLQWLSGYLRRGAQPPQPQPTPAERKGRADKKKH